MSDTLNKDQSDALTSLLSLSGQTVQGPPPPTAAPAVSAAVPKPDDDNNNKSKKPKPEQSKSPAASKDPVAAPPAAKKDTPKKKEESTPKIAAPAPKESLTEAAVKHLKNAANMVKTAASKMPSPTAASPVDPPKGWDREVESILEPETKKEKDDNDGKKVAAAAKEEEDSKKDVMEEAKLTPKRTRRVASKSVGSPGGTNADGSKKKKKVSAKSVLQGDTLTGTWSGLAAAEEKDKKRKAEQKKAAPKKKKKPSASPAEPRVAPKEVYSGEPEATDKLTTGEPWPPGWTKKKFQRRGGTARGRPDPYWYTPVEKKKLRSMNEVNRFMAALKEANGDESKAWTIFKKSK